MTKFWVMRRTYQSYFQCLAVGLLLAACTSTGANQEETITDQVILDKSLSIFAQSDTATHRIELAVAPGEGWWGGNVVDGRQMPFGSAPYALDQNGNVGGNQAQPLLISNQGRYIWSEAPLRVRFEKQTLRVTAAAPIEVYQDGKTLRDAFIQASRQHFPASGTMPDSLFFSRPQYNTWIELQYDQNEQDILHYAASIVGQGFPAGVLMIDDTWQTDYGVWDFSAQRFPNPRAMMTQLHTLGFKVMLWVCPFVSPDSPAYRELARTGALMFADEEKTRPAIVAWWNGQSALIDLTNPEGEAWYLQQMQDLIDDYGVDGFKLDAGDANFYRGIFGQKDVSPNTHTELHTRIGLHFPFNEYRASWKMAGQPLVQRLRDKNHEWEDLKALIPDMIALGLMGHPFSCPDMIGGGEVGSFENDAVLDEELIVRSTQVHALMPMMQFSVAPWRVLSPKNLAICRRMAQLHQRMGPQIVQLAQRSATSGEPIIRPLDYVFPNQGFSQVSDQFMLGDSVLVAPVLEQGARTRKVTLPKGRWRADDGQVIKGPTVVEVNAPLDRLPWFERLLR